MDPKKYPHKGPKILLIDEEGLRTLRKGKRGNMSDGIGIRGDLTIIKRDSDGPDAGVIEEIEVGDNLVVTVGLNAIMRSIVGFEHPTNTISELQVGDGATGPSSSPDAPVAGDTVLGNFLRSRNFDAQSFPGTGQLLLVASIPTSVGAGEAYNEAGLFAASGSPNILVARKTFAEINKDTTFSLEFRWTLSLVAT